MIRFFLNQIVSKIYLTLLLALLFLKPISGFADSLSNYIITNPDGSQTLTGHVPLDVKNGLKASYHDAKLNLNLQIILPLANQNQLNNKLQDLYDSQSPNFHHFLSSSDFAQQYKASSVDTAQVIEYLNNEGISTPTSINGTILNVSGTVVNFERAFGIQINIYQKNGKNYFSPNVDPTIPTILAGKILAIGGLDDFPKYWPNNLKYPMSKMPKAIGTGPGGFLAPGDVKNAYNLNSISSNGSGQTIALFELSQYNSSDITTYLSNFFSTNTPNVTLTNILIDRFNESPDYTNGFADEATIEIELTIAFASGIDSVLIYEGHNTTHTWIDEWTRIATDNKAKVVSSSWSDSEDDTPTRVFDGQIFQQMAAQGQSVLVAAGSNGAYVINNGISTLSVSEPAAEPYVTAVGISKLTCTNINGSYIYNNEAASLIGGGGISAYQTTPNYQAMAAFEGLRNRSSTSMRNVPDVALTADSSMPYAFYVNGAWMGYYGSSISTAIWTSFIAQVNQGLGGNAPIGFVNPTIYKRAQTNSYAYDFNHINMGNNAYYPAMDGFNNAVGLGSFNGFNLYTDLTYGNKSK